MSGSYQFRISITGTPGSGKSSLSNHTCDVSKYELIQVSELAEKYGVIGDMDYEDGARPIDIDSLAQLLEGKWKLSPTHITIIDGHLSHLLPVDAIVILRCNPEVLQVRMKNREWSQSKIDENAEWELLGAAWNDEHEWGNTPVLELDSSQDSVESLFSQIEAWIRDGFKPKSPEQRIDWITVLHGE